MKRATAILMAIILSALSTASCAGTGPAAPLPPGGYITLPLDLPHEKIDPVDPRKAGEMRIAIPKEMENPHVLSLPGGGALALGQKTRKNERNGTESSKLMASAYGADGKTLWSRTYTELEDGYVSQALPLPGGGFVFSYGALVQYENGQYSPNTQTIVFCGGDGSVLNRRRYAQIGVFGYLCATDAGEVYAVGEAGFRGSEPADDPGQADGDPDVSVMKFDASGSLLFTKRIGGSDFDSPAGAFWSKETGLVVSIRTQAADGGLKAPGGVGLDERGHAVLLAAINGDGTEKWQHWEDNRNNLYYGELIPAGGGALVSGYRGGRAFVMKLDKDGKKLWETAPDGDGEYSVVGLAALEGGGFAAAINRYTDGDSQKGGYLALYDANGAVKSRTRLPNVTVTRLAPTADGGLISIAMQNIRTLPQPAYLSCIWYDTETIATRYDGELNILWRKVYDRYRDSTKADIAVPAADGRIIVEK